MTTAPDRIAVIAMQLARTDPRALSQAWYDSLHHATQAAPMATARKPLPPAEESDRQRPLVPQRVAARAPLPPRSAQQRRSHDLRTARPIAREGVNPAQRAARIVASAGHAPRPFSRTVTLGSSRVRLLVRTDAGVTRVVALCAEADRERVGRALAQVRLALAGAGVTLAA